MQSLNVKTNESGFKMLTRAFLLGNEEDTWRVWHSALDVLLIKSDNEDYEESEHSEHHSDQSEIGKQFCGIWNISPICRGLQFEGNIIYDPY